ncbi:pyridoxamine 5'-phosphate oxidase family protein [Maribacter sp. ACAM166]|uniref:pyridoxamine 5'-phosphate oxidase family protein n=1 Tax=Maribacter sp. ACAM166 TaxID=2508996 RepID=UPI0010FCE85D|nr:pyridoxamine 5'-phosphate oxidase family protein [Maribacter sp. ACAM166]TLP81790.1 flavin mononucleotide-binding protein [Maribacter sp. ACAM166]
MIKDLSTKTCIDMLAKNYIGRLGFIAKGEPYIIPVTYYYYDKDHNSIISYSAEGHKIEAMRKNRNVSLEVDEITSVNHWRSVLVHGLFEELEQIDAKYLLHQFAEGVKKVITEREHEHPQFIGEFSAKLKGEGIPVVYRIKIREITGKKRQG